MESSWASRTGFKDLKRQFSAGSVFFRLCRGYYKSQGNLRMRLMVGDFELNFAADMITLAMELNERCG